MKNLFLALFMLAGTIVMAQSSTADLKKDLGLTEVQAKQVAEIQAKFCNDKTGCNLPEGKTKADMSEKEYNEAMAKAQRAYYNALTEVIPADKAEKLLAECRKTCDEASAKSEGAKKSCCPGGEKKKKSCH